MTRIRYYRQDDNSFKSKGINAPHDILTIQLNGLDYKIISSLGETLYTAVAKDNVSMKKEIRQVLKSQGVIFNDEIRNKKGKTNV